MRKSKILFAMTIAACSSSGRGGADSETDGVTAGAPGSGTVGDSGAATGTAGDGGTGEAEDDGPGLQFDVGHGGNDYCKFKDAGTYCDENTAVVCGDAGDVLDTDDCSPNTCLAGTGCVECLAGQYDCQGDRVMVCNADASPPVWQEVEVCDAADGQGCDIAMGACIDLEPIGGTEPTGVYYQFADFTTAAGFNGGYDVDSYGDRLYVVSLSQTIDVYTVELLDTDADGKLEPNQHPENPDATGPIEQRVLTFVESIPWATGDLSPSVNELFVLEDRFYIGGTNLTQYLFAGGATMPITTAPGWLSRFSQIAYDEVNSVWYASNENDRRVFQHDAATNSWGLAFYFPNMSGDHMDGLEVVTDPNTGTPYVYVSDMTSDFIGQYRKDPALGWVQENLFSYQGTTGAPVEGMGYGALNHFWATAGNSLYEIGGGDLATYTEPPG